MTSNSPLLSLPLPFLITLMPLLFPPLLSPRLLSSIILRILISAVFTITGGLTAVMFTDFIETVIMVIGGVILGGIALHKVGGYNEMVKLFPTAYASYASTSSSVFGSSQPGRNVSLCNDTIPSNFMHFMRPVTDGDLPWTGITFGLTISATWYWCTDQGDEY